MAWGILPATVHSSRVRRIHTSQWVYALAERSKSNKRRQSLAERTWPYWPKFKVVTILCWRIHPLFLASADSSVRGIHFGDSAQRKNMPRLFGFSTLTVILLKIWFLFLLNWRHLFQVDVSVSLKANVLWVYWNVQAPWHFFFLTVTLNSESNMDMVYIET